MLFLFTLSVTILHVSPNHTHTPSPSQFCIISSALRFQHTHTHTTRTHAQVIGVDRVNRSVKRGVNNAMAPVQSTLAEAVQGRALVRAMELRPYVATRFLQAVDTWARFSAFSAAILDWAMLVSFCSAFLITTLTCVFIIADRDNFEPAETGTSSSAADY